MDITYEIPLRLADGGTWPIGPFISDEFPDRQRAVADVIAQEGE